MSQCDPPCPVELCAEWSKGGMCSIPAPAIGTGRCEFEDAATADRCVNRGIALTLRDPLGNYCRRVLCGEHSDWVQHPPQEPEHGSHG